MSVTELGIVIEVRPVSQKVPSLILIIPGGKDILDNLVQEEKAYIPIASTEFGIVISDSSEQYLKHWSPMLVSVFGRLMLLIREHL